MWFLSSVSEVQGRFAQSLAASSSKNAGGESGCKGLVCTPESLLNLVHYMGVQSKRLLPQEWSRQFRWPESGQHGILSHGCQIWDEAEGSPGSSVASPPQWLEHEENSVCSVFNCDLHGPASESSPAEATLKLLPLGVEFDTGLHLFVFV